MEFMSTVPLHTSFNVTLEQFLPHENYSIE